MKQNKSQFKRLILSQEDFMQNFTKVLFYKSVLTRIKHKINSLFFTLINAQVIYQNKKGDAYRKIKTVTFLVEAFACLSIVI